MRRVVVCALVLASCGGGPLDHKRLAGRVRELRALAAEAQLLDHTQHPRAFAAEHRKSLAAKVHEANEALAHGVDDFALEPFHMLAMTLGARLEIAVGAGIDTGSLELPLAALQTRLEN